MRIRSLIPAAALALALFSLPVFAAEPDPAAALAKLRAAAEAGDARSQFELGDSLAVGDGVTRDLKEAAVWFRRAAEQGVADAQNALGLLYSHGQGGFARDHEEALRWFRRAAEQGNASSQFWLGQAYEWGHGVPADYAESAKWYRRAAEQGNVSAQHSLGKYYAEGRGVPRDAAEAVRWIRKAVEQHDAAAQYELGTMYGAGTGVEKSDTEAVRWYRQAADQGFTVAQTSLGESLEHGKGQAKDLLCAYFWYSLAAEQGFDEGVRLRDLLAPKLTAEQIREALRMAKASDQEQPFIERPLCPGEPISMTVEALPYAELVQMLERFTGLKVVGPEKIPGTVKVDLADVPWETAFTEALKGFGQRWAREGETLRVVPLAPAGSK